MRITCKVKTAAASAASRSSWTLKRNGRVVAHGSAASALKVSGLKKGRYVLRLTAKGAVVTRTLIVR
ncbi:MAG: hypothetical protein QOH62_1709 [Solirubrobacteraceae bacterium]|jgi:hypothetical protein|nr:hypothetical protein [Solirubrobacteraceae bacterium]